jgi:outer membrane protein insertion porin family
VQKVFERLKNKTDVNEQKRQQDELNARLFAQQHKAQERLGELVRSPYKQLEPLLRLD